MLNQNLEWARNSAQSCKVAYLAAQGRAYSSFDLRLLTPCHHLLYQFEPALPIRLPLNMLIVHFG
jgi:hypothetical protein